MNNPDVTAYTLGALLSWPDDVIRRNAISILKRLQALQGAHLIRGMKAICINCGYEKDKRPFAMGCNGPCRYASEE